MPVEQQKTPSKQDAVLRPATLRRELLLLFLMVLSVFVMTSAGFDTSEARYHYMVARQIVTHGSLSFSDPPKGIFTVGPNGRTYASHEIGNTIFLIPVAVFNLGLEKALAPRLDSRRLDYVTGFFVALVPAVYCAITTVLLYALLRVVFDKSLTTALAASLAFTFCTFVWTYSRNLFDGVLCMALLTGAMLAMMQFRRTASTRLFLLALTLLGCGVITRLSMVLALVAFWVYVTILFWRDRTRMIRLVLLGGAVLLPFAAWQAYYNLLRTGNWLLSPVQTAQYPANALTGNLALGLAYMLFSPGKSVFVYFPLAVLSVLCFRRFRTAYRPEAVFVAVLSGLWLLLHAKLAAFTLAWGPKYLITIAPVLALPACVVWESMTENFIRRSILSFALAWGFVLSASSIIGNWFFRVQLASVQGRDRDMVWSLSGGQALDMITGAASNFRNIILHQPGPTIPDLSPANRYASNTVNVWFNSAAYNGAPRVLLAGIALVLVMVAAYCLVTFRQLIVRNRRTEQHEVA
ncbi:MAG TPA: glycosyltransferase family 39 protein [Bryobacteraceae bacterium]|nr:glycosyltransferase family 39 protein [Bryobacteraceae bacterium]